MTLWVRETWAPSMFHQPGQRDSLRYFYKANENKKFINDTKWKPSIFMPRDACRLFLEVTGIRAERLQDITESDAEKEGTKIPVNKSGTWLQCLTGPYIPKAPTYKEHFRLLWETINKKRGFPWDSNPWVWVIDFKIIEKK